MDARGRLRAMGARGRLRAIDARDRLRAMDARDRIARDAREGPNCARWDARDRLRAMDARDRLHAMRARGPIARDGREGPTARDGRERPIARDGREGPNGARYRPEDPVKREIQQQLPRTAPNENNELGRKLPERRGGTENQKRISALSAPRRLSGEDMNWSEMQPRWSSRESKSEPRGLISLPHRRSWRHRPCSLNLCTRPSGDRGTADACARHSGPVPA